MKKCNDCNVEMVDGRLYGKPKFIDMDHDINKFYVDVQTGNKTNILGLEVAETKRSKLNVRICPNCGKVELYINPNEIER